MPISNPEAPSCRVKPPFSIYLVDMDKCMHVSCLAWHNLCKNSLTSDENVVYFLSSEIELNNQLGDVQLFPSLRCKLHILESYFKYYL